MMPLKLLVVDDEADFAEFVADVAEDMDFDVSSTNDPNEFSSLYSSDIDIVILDLFMPDVDGIELLRYLSEHGSDASVVFMSGKDIGVLRSAQELAMEQRIDVLGTLQKPFRAEQLENVLAGFVRKSSAKISANDELPSLAEIQQALDRDELFLMYQPQINIADRRVAGAEALIRWKHPTKGMIPPGIFIPITEESELIFPLIPSCAA